MTEPITEDQWDAYGRAATGIHAAMMPLGVAFGIAERFKNHKMLLSMIHLMLVTRFGPERVRRRFEIMGTPSFTKKEQDTTLLTCFAASGLSQQAFARKAAAYNQSSPAHPYGTGCTEYDAMLKVIKRARKRHPKFYADIKRFYAKMPPGFFDALRGDDEDTSPERRPGTKL
jgi:hypothetical protein